tara:strand:+ start:2418 stop:2975 length:558 start_codon:yes stop_codon:yes gene_type:complete
MPYKNFSRRCEMCNHTFNNYNNWRKHIITIKHKKNVEQNVEIEKVIPKDMSVDMKIFQLEQELKLLKSITTKTTNNSKPPPQLKQVCIYCICVGDDNYVGHSFNIENRKSTHKQSCNHNNNLLYKCIRDIGGWDNVKFTELALYDECDLTKAIEMETKHFYEIKPNLNKCVPTNTLLINPFIKSS